MWKSVDGEIINNSFDVPANLNEFLDNELGEDIEEFLKQAFDVSIDEVTVANDRSMQSMVHRCIRCEAVAFETKPRFFHCADCGFEWEVL
jgi:flagellin-specific chaperone FliS